VFWSFASVAASKPSFTRFSSKLYCVAVAGHLPKPADGPMHVGKVGREVTTEDAYKSARLVAVNIIATLKGPRFLQTAFVFYYLTVSFWLCLSGNW
jgi:hypothetical protein